MAVSYTCIAWSMKEVLKKFSFLRPEMRLSTRKLQNDLHRALIALAVCPLVSSMVPCGAFMICIFLKINIVQISPFLLIFVSSVTLFNPVTTVYYVRPFRRYVLNMLFCQRVPVAFLGTSISFSGTSGFGVKVPDVVVSGH